MVNTHSLQKLPSHLIMLISDSKEIVAMHGQYKVKKIPIHGQYIKTGLKLDSIHGQYMVNTLLMHLTQTEFYSLRGQYMVNTWLMHGQYMVNAFLGWQSQIEMVNTWSIRGQYIVNAFFSVRESPQNLAGLKSC